jgi:hypothetical protein
MNTPPPARSGYRDAGNWNGPIIVDSIKDENNFIEMGTAAHPTIQHVRTTSRQLIDLLYILPHEKEQALYIDTVLIAYGYLYNFSAIGSYCMGVSINRPNQYQLEQVMTVIKMFFKWSLYGTPLSTLGAELLQFTSFAPAGQYSI